MSKEKITPAALKARMHIADQLEMFSVTGLLPCPFCRSVDLSSVSILLDDGTRKTILIECNACGATGPISESMDQLRALWNVRA